MTVPEHNQLPGLHVHPGSMVIWTDKSEIIAETGGANFTEEESVEHARLIVTATNSHADLLAAAKRAHELLTPGASVSTLALISAVLSAAIEEAEQA